MPSPPKRNTTTQLSTLTTSSVEVGLVNGPTASLVLDSNIDFSTTGTTSAPRIPIWIPAPVISAKSFPPESYAYVAATKDLVDSHYHGGPLAPNYDTPGSTGQAAHNAPPSVWLSWRGPLDGYTSEWLNHNPRYFLYYYTFNRSTDIGASMTRTYSPNRSKKWKHPLNFTYPTPSGYPPGIADNIFNRTTEWSVENGPLLISALNFSAGPTASWNDGFHPNQYMAGGGGATFFGSSSLFPIAATGSPYSVWARDYGNMDVRRAARQGQVPWQKRITLAFKFRIVIDHPQDPGRLMYGPYSETLLFRPEVGYFTATPKIGPVIARFFYYKWGVKVK